MIDEMQAIGYVVTALIAIFSISTPLIKLNSSITKLNVLLGELSQKQRDTDARVASHEQKLQDLEIVQVQQDGRITALENINHRP